MSKTILVVDDDRACATWSRRTLEQEGLRVVTAGNGQEALHVARQEQPDLIILDLMMPVMDGYAFMRAQAKERDIPVILLTAKVDESDKVLGLELGADDYVTKPFSLRELLARVRAVLRRAGSAPAGADVLRAADVVLDKTTPPGQRGRPARRPDPLRIRAAGRPHGRAGRVSLAWPCSTPCRAPPTRATSARSTSTCAICAPRSKPTRATRAMCRPSSAWVIASRMSRQRLPSAGASRIHHELACSSTDDGLSGRGGRCGGLVGLLVQWAGSKRDRPLRLRPQTSSP